MARKRPAAGFGGRHKSLGPGLRDRSNELLGRKREVAKHRAVPALNLRPICARCGRAWSSKVHK